MSVKEIVSGLHLIKLGGAVNAYVIESEDDGLTLIDAGWPKHLDDIEAGIRSMGREPSDLTDILVTHAHPDHVGSAARISAGSVPVSMPADEAWIARAGRYDLTMSAAPGFFKGVMFRLLFRSESYEFPAFEPQKSLTGGDVLDIAGGIEVIHTPGHSAGHMSLLWKKDRSVLLTGDAVVNVPSLGYAVAYDDFETGKHSAAKLAELDFEVAAFGHGRPILSNASSKFTKKFH